MEEDERSDEDEEEEVVEIGTVEWLEMKGNGRDPDDGEPLAKRRGTPQSGIPKSASEAPSLDPLPCFVCFRFLFVFVFKSFCFLHQESIRSSGQT